MPTYEVDIPGQGTFQVDTPTEMSNDELNQAFFSQQSAPEQPSAPTPDIAGTYEKYWGAMAENPEADPISKFAGITGRRAGSALDALIGLPGAASDLVTGGTSGRLDAALRILQGVTSPFSAAIAPVEAAGETAAGSVLSPGLARLAGDVTGLGTMFGLGALSKAGKLGEGLETYAKVIGVGRPKTYEEMVTRDPQLRYVVEQMPKIDTSGATELEKMARGAYTTDELAMQLNRPNLAQVALQSREFDNYSWQEMAKENIVHGDMPPEPSLKVGDVVFGPGARRDANLLDTLGTPASRASAIDPEFGGKIANDINLTEMEIKNAMSNRSARLEKGFSGLTDAQVHQAKILSDAMNLEDIMRLPEKDVPQPVKDFVQFMHNRDEVNRQIAIPRMRDDVRDGIAAQVKREMGDTATTAEMAQEISKRVLNAVPDNIGADKIWRNTFPGSYSVVDKAGHVLGVFETPLGWKGKVYELAQSGKIDAKDLDVQMQAYLETDLLNRFKGRVKSTVNHMIHGLTPTPDEVQAAARGDFSFARTFDMLNPFKDKGNLKGYADQLKDMLYIEDRSTERWLQVRDLLARIKPDLQELRDRNYKKLAEDLLGNAESLWGHRMAGSAYLDNLVAATPILRDVAAPQMLERWTNAGKTALVNVLLKFNPRFQAINATQVLQTLWPIADMSEIVDAIKLKGTQIGQQLLDKHIRNLGSKIEGTMEGLGPTERFNQETAFLTMYNRARQLGLNDYQAGAYGKLRGNLYSQFVGLTTDVPIAFRKLDPLGLFTMFRRFNIKQAEQAIDLMKNSDFPGMAKWLGVNLAMGGFKSATMGQAGWLTYKLYKEIEDNYGKGVADLFHTGLPSLLGSDISSSTQLFDPPFGENWKERLSNFAQGPFVGLASSVMSSAMNNAAVDPSMAHRVLRTLASKNPLTRGLFQVFGEDNKYDFKDPSGRLKFKGDVSDIIKTFAGVHPAGGVMGMQQGPMQMKQAELDTFVDAFMEVNEKRNDVLDWAASRYGAAKAAGVDLGGDFQKAIEKEVDAWNNLWPEFPITGTDLRTRGEARLKTATTGMAQRMMQGVPAAIRKSPVFAPSVNTSEEIPPPPGRLPFEFFGGG